MLFATICSCVVHFLLLLQLSSLRYLSSHAFVVFFSCVPLLCSVFSNAMFVFLPLYLSRVFFHFPWCWFVIFFIFSFNPFYLSVLLA